MSKSTPRVQLSRSDDHAQVKYTLTIPSSLDRDIQEIANNHQVDVREVIRQFIKLGFVAEEILQQGGELILEHNGERTSITIFKETT